jgi:predicted short-subunit dehydrogenase-like oxidoreductase (DUF2520 family)
MDVVILGTGNTATILGRKLKNAGHRIVQVYGRDAKAASALAYKLGSESTTYKSVVSRDADIYLIAVSDNAVKELVAELKPGKKTAVHTAAAVSKDILKNTAEHYGVFYPLQTLTQQSVHLPETPIIIDASDEETFTLLKSLAESISENVVEAGDEQRLKLHLAAVFCNNFTNHLYALMEDYCHKEKLDFKLLVPLIQETALRLSELPPSQSQTGPAVRNDEETIRKHLALLVHYPDLTKLYQIFTDSIYRGQFKG